MLFSRETLKLFFPEPLDDVSPTENKSEEYNQKDDEMDDENCD
jgi:hypothetical protein